MATSHVPHRRKDDESEIDLTPMLDVVFIMLIFFIVTASFIKEAGVEVSRPESQSNDESESKNMLFQVTTNDEIWFDGRRIDVRSVRANIERAHAENPEAAVVIRAHNNSNTETFVAITDAAREAGVYDVSLALTDQ